MARSWLMRYGLILALVFAQTLYAGHNNLHQNTDFADCQICLQSSSGGAALPVAHVAVTPTDWGRPQSAEYTSRSSISSYPDSHPTRAPPVSLT